MDRNNTFQGFRGLFAIGVLLSHCSFLNDTPIWRYVSPLSNVSFFYILAGFLLVRTYKQSSFFSFLKRKLIRIYPLHFCMLLLMIVFKIISKTFDFSMKNYLTIICHLFLIQTWIPNVEIATAYNTVSWFLSSLLFCFSIGYLLVSALRNNEKKTRIIANTIALLFLLLKIIIAIIHPSDNNWGYYFTYLCPLAALPDFLIGFEIANWKKSKLLIIIEHWFNLFQLY